MSGGRMVLGVLVAVLMTAGIGALSQVPYRAESDAQAWIRLSWRMSAARVEECRTLTAEELAKRPIHMRRDKVCEVRGIPYRLRVVLNDAAVEEATLRGAGTRNDLPIYVYRELRVEPGRHRLEVRVAPEVGREAPAESAETSQLDGARSLELDRDLVLAAGEVALVTLGEDGQLVVRGPEP